jgi:host factor-I protein
MNKLPINVQDSFFNALRHDESLVEVILVNGETRLGRLKRFDRFAVVLDVSGHEELVYKHAIAAVRASGSPVASRAPAQPGS